MFRLFNPQNPTHATYGFISIAEIKKLITDEDTQLVVPAVCNTGLAVELDKSRIILPKSVPSQLYLFIPSVRIGGFCTSKEQSSLYIVYRSKKKPPDMIGMFVQALMALRYSVQLYPTKEHNTVTLILQKGFILTLVFHGDCVQLKLPSSDQKELTAVCMEVLSCCSNALSCIKKNFFPDHDLEYNYAILCLNSNDDYPYETLPCLVKHLCPTCELFVNADNQLKAWYDTVQHVCTEYDM